MKTIFIFTFFCLLHLLILESPEDFESKLNDIVAKFKREILDKQECEKYKREADDLVEEIKKSINSGDYTNEEVSKLNKLKGESEALEEYIAAVGGCANYVPSISDFNLANKRVKGNITQVSLNKFCIDIFSVEIDNYIVYLGVNNTSNNYTVSYNWKSATGNGGSGTMGLTSKCVRHIYDNREHTNRKKITISNIKCVPF